MHAIITKPYASPYGDLLLGSLNNALVLCDWRYRHQRQALDRRIMTHFDAHYTDGDSDCLRRAGEQLDEYFRGERRTFDLPLRTAGTAFQQAVWAQLQTIAYGDTLSYGDLAQRVDNPKAVRAVGAANGANALAILIPCHRVIANTGDLGGYAGGLAAKRRLLALEKAAATAGKR